MKKKVSPRDLRYVAVKLLIEQGYITQFHQIFEVIPKTVFIEDLGKNYNNFVDKIGQPTKFKMEMIKVMATRLDVSDDKMFKIANTIHMDKPKS